MTYTPSMTARLPPSAGRASMGMSRPCGAPQCGAKMISSPQERQVVTRQPVISAVGIAPTACLRDLGRQRRAVELAEGLPKGIVAVGGGGHGAVRAHLMRGPVLEPGLARLLIAQPGQALGG